MNFIIADKRLPVAVIEKLTELGEVMLFETKDITYPSISGHPDIFLTQIENQIIIAPNTPEDFRIQLEKCKIRFQTGQNPVGNSYPETSYYNAVIDGSVLIHHPDFTDSVIRQCTGHLFQISTNQGYSRCNCISLNSKGYICSDRSIERSLKSAGRNVIYVNPEGIVLKGHDYGFFGGTAGVCNDQLILSGSLKYYRWGDEVKHFAEMTGFSVVELYDGPLVDGGGIFFLNGV